MPKFLERKLKAQYGKDSKIPYKIMNAKGYMKGSKETEKGKMAEAKHKKKTLPRVRPGRGNKQIAQGRAYEV